MNRPATAVFAALESLLVVGIGVGVPVVALTFLWAFQYGLQVDWGVFWRTGVDIWLIGHGVDVTLTLSKSAAAATGIAGAGTPILISIAALGFAVLTLLLGARTGRRLAETRHRAIGCASAIASFAVLSALVTATAHNPLAEPVSWQGIVLPTLIFAIPVMITAEINRRRRDADPDPVTAAVLRFADLVPDLGRAMTAVCLRAGAAVTAIVLAVAGVIVALLLIAHYASIIALYEGAHSGVLGGLALTIGQVALIPNAVAWTASWLVGPGFALGQGSSISPIGTTIGPMPAVPLLGALPTSELAFGFVGILVPVIAAFVVATVLRPRVEELLGDDDSLLTRALVGVGTGVAAGIMIGFVAAASSGSAGPGRLAQVGPDGFVVGAFAALEVAAPAVLALILRQPEWSRRLERTDTRPDREFEHDARVLHDAASPHDAPSLHDAASLHDARATDVLPRLDRAPDETSTERLDGFTR